MSNTSVLSKKQSLAPSTPPRPSVLSENDLQLVAERLSLIRGHIGQMPAAVVSGARSREGYLIVALKIPGHMPTIEYANNKDMLGAWKIDGQPVETFAPLTEKELK
jgi:hypothetical protein